RWAYGWCRPELTLSFHDDRSARNGRRNDWKWERHAVCLFAPYHHDTTWMPLSLSCGEPIMSTFQPFSNDCNTLKDYVESGMLGTRERTLGHLLVIAVILLAIYLRSL